MTNIIVKNYEHYNRAMGKHITSKKHYFEEMKKGGYVPLEEGQRLAESKKESQWTPSKDCVDIVRELYDKKEKTIKLTDYPKIIEKMKEKGVTFDMNKINEMTRSK